MMTSKVPNKKLTFGLTAYCICFTIGYLYFPSLYVFFLILYCLASLVGILLSIKIYRKSETTAQQKQILLISVAFYLGAFFFFWVPENLFCSHLQHLNLHAWFHISAALGSYLWLVFSAFERGTVLNRRPRIVYDLPLPFVKMRDDEQL